MSSFEEFSRVHDEMLKWKAAELELSNAYLRLRQMIPGAFDTPRAPTRYQVWATTEHALKKFLESATPPLNPETSQEAPKEQ